MREIKPYIRITLIVLTVIILYNPLVVVFANVMTLFRENNEDELLKTSYTEKIEALEKTISEYEKSLQNLNIFSNYSNVLAKIALRDLYDFYDFLEVAVDKKVSAGDAVLNEDGLVGIVKEANLYTAKVSLLTSGTKLSVKVGENYGMLGGYDNKNDEFVVHNIDNYKKVEVGEEVVTSGLQDVRENIPVGTVKRVENDGVENTVYVTPKVDFDNLNYLIVEAK